MQKIPVGISSCLLGHEVRYDGSHRYNSYIEQTLGQYFQFSSFCPEVECGLGIPRPAVQLRDTLNGIRCVGVKDHELDVTERLQAASANQYHCLKGLCGYILKKDSPSCGMSRVKVYRQDVPSKTGTGIFAAYIQQTFPLLPLEEEGRLGDPILRENFIQRVFVLHRWQQLCQQGISISALMNFHSQHKLIAMSHDQNQARALGKFVADTHPDNLEAKSTAYILALMECLKRIATRGNHVNVLQHIQGYLKHKLDNDDKLELVNSIEAYRLQQLPLIVPLTLLKHHFRKQPDHFIDQSYYMQPHPAELALLNAI